MNLAQLKQILDDHRKWLRDEGGSRADLQGANLREADLRWADLRRANLQGVNLWRADLRRADLRGADLQEADLQEADLRGADLRGADLQEADLHGADLQGANLQEADLQEARLTHCIGDEASILGLSLRGLRWPVWVSPDKKTIAIGCQKHSVEGWRGFTDGEIEAMSPNALGFWREYRRIILANAGVFE